MPPVSTDPNVWFLASRQNSSAQLSTFTSENLVEPLIDGQSYMQRIHDLMAATVADDYIFYAGWRLDRDQELIQGGGSATYVEPVFRDARWRGVDVHVMLSKHVANKNGKIHQIFSVQLLPPIQSVHDARFPTYGSHHQKFASILHDGTLHAFCGGIDLAVDRRDDSNHSEGGWHDIQCYVRGPAAQDLDLTFRERWNDPKRPAKFAVIPPPITRPVPVPSPAGPHHVQVLRTYACDIGYPFAPQGEFSVREACLKAIGLAEDYIYIEDQFFCAYEVADALLAALTAHPSLRVIVVVPKEQFPPYPWAFNRHQGVLINKLTAAAPDRFAVYHLHNPMRVPEQIYVHCKTIIIDDVWVKIGSTNLCRRDMTHDSQVDLAVVDSTIEEGVCKFARDLRLALWGEHLALATSDPDIRDPVTGFDTWQRRAGILGVPAEPHPAPSGHSPGWNTYVDPQKLCPGTPRIPP